MSHYDDDRVVELLRDVVPPVPDQPDRLAAIRRRAGHQRAVLWSQTLGAVASVLLIVGVAAAVSSGTDSGEVDPTDRPISALADALLREKSVRFEGLMSPVGTPPAVMGQSPEQVRRMLTAQVTGAATRDGDFQLRGDMSFATFFGDTHDGGETQIRHVDGVLYRTPMTFEDLPAGKKWVSSDEGTPPSGVDQVVDLLRMAERFARDVRYVGPATVRGTPVAEYRLTVPEQYSGQRVDVTFALDAEDRLRRVAAQFSYRDMLMGGIEDELVVEGGESRIGTGGVPGSPPPSPTPGYDEHLGFQPPADPVNVRVEVQLFGYGDDVDIEAPPAREVIDENELHEDVPAQHPDMDRLEDCMEEADTDAERDKCFTEIDGSFSPAMPNECPPTTVSPDGSWSCAPKMSPVPGTGPGQRVPVTAVPLSPAA